MAKKYHVTRSGEERDELTTLLRKGKASTRKLTQARVLLHVNETASGSGCSDEQTAQALPLSMRTVGRFVEQGLAAA